MSEWVRKCVSEHFFPLFFLPAPFASGAAAAAETKKMRNQNQFAKQSSSSASPFSFSFHHSFCFTLQSHYHFWCCVFPVFFMWKWSFYSFSQKAVNTRREKIPGNGNSAVRFMRQKRKTKAIIALFRRREMILVWRK